MTRPAQRPADASTDADPTPADGCAPSAPQASPKGAPRLTFAPLRTWLVLDGRRRRIELLVEAGAAGQLGVRLRSKEVDGELREISLTLPVEAVDRTLAAFAEARAEIVARRGAASTWTPIAPPARRYGGGR